MPLTSGTKLGHYEITAPIGAGGMGEVYRARDTRLKRDVALKVLPSQFAEDTDRVARFAREAEVLASLNHPNIAAIYGVEDRALAMELVEGESPKGPMPFDEAWKIASQIADALEYAHDKGVIHRDLKPANIKVTPDGVVKLLDFGLAKAFHDTPDSHPGDPVNSPTITLGATVAGTIMGTAAYMAPEQAKGKRVDKRADIWSWGVVLYELLTGERLFKGEDAADTLARVLMRDPDLGRVPARARRVLEECLQKDPKLRLRDIGAARYLIESGTELLASPSRRWMWLALTAAAVLIAVGLTVFVTRLAAQPLRPLVRFDVDLGENVSLGAVFGSDITISPDGSRIVYVSGNQLLMQRLDQLKAAPVALPGTAGAIMPFFSPDGKWIGYAVARGFFKLPTDGGAAVQVITIGGNDKGASWLSDGQIITQLSTTPGLVRFSEGGGVPEPLTQLAPGEIAHRWPQVLPAGKAVLFTAGGNVNFDAATIEVLDLRSGQRKTVQRGGSFGRYVAASDGTGYLTYLNRRTMFAVPFDLEHLEVRGTPIPMLDEVGFNASDGSAMLDFSRTGTLVYRTSVLGLTEHRLLQFMDAKGQTQPVLIPTENYRTPRLSSDGRRLLVTVGRGTGDVWVYDLQDGKATRLTIDGTALSPIWTPDGRFVVFRGLGGMYWTRSDGASQPRLLTQSKNNQLPSSFTPDGKRLVYRDLSPENRFDLWTLPVENSAAGLKPGTSEKFLATPKDERDPSFSSDGRWIAYASDETGQFEIYVRAFPDRGTRWPISSNGGRLPIFSNNGHELFYVTDQGQIMISRYTVKDDTFVADPPRAFSDKKLVGSVGASTFDLAPDGRILGIFPAEAASKQPSDHHVTFLLNFADEIRRRVGTGR